LKIMLDFFLVLYIKFLIRSDWPLFRPEAALV